MDFLIGFLTQIISSAGIIFLFGFIIALLRRAFCALAPRNGHKILLATGIVGTPIHELSHALMCLIFGHKIDEIQLYQPNSDDGTLGYVSHSYNRRNIYHQIGNFFIGVAPVLLGGGVIVLLLLLLLPDACGDIMDELRDVCTSGDVGFRLGDFFSFLGETIGEIFSSDSLTSWQGWVFIILAIMIASHTELSGADIKGGLKGYLFLAIVILFFDVVLALLFPDLFPTFVGLFASFAFLLSAFLSISVIFLVLMVLVALACKLIFSR